MRSETIMGLDSCLWTQNLIVVSGTIFVLCLIQILVSNYYRESVPPNSYYSGTKSQCRLRGVRSRIPRTNLCRL